MLKFLSGVLALAVAAAVLMGCGNREAEPVAETAAPPAANGSLLTGEQTAFLDGTYRPIVDEDDIRAMLRAEGIDDPGELDINQEISSVASQMNAIQLQISQGQFQLTLDAFGSDQAYAGDVIVTPDNVRLEGDEFEMEFDYDIETRTLILIPGEDHADIPPLKLRWTEDQVS